MTRIVWLALLAALLLGAGTAGARQKLPRGSVNSATVKDRSLRGKDVKPKTIKAGLLNLKSVGKVLQARLTGACGEGEALSAIAADGAVTCAPVAGGVDVSGFQRRLGQCDAHSAIRAAGDDGAVDCVGVVSAFQAEPGLTSSITDGKLTVGVDTSYLQRRLSAACTGRDALTGVAQSGEVACSPFVTDVRGGTGLTRSIAGGEVTLDADPAVLQRRVTGSCPGTSSISSINQDGTVGCESSGTGTVTSVGLASGSGLTSASNPITTTGTIDTDPAILQRRLDGSCAGTTAAQSFGVNGTVDCSGALQSRVSGTCAGTTAAQSVAADGAVGCSPSLQSRVTGTCTTTSANAVQSVAANGTVTCGNLQNRVTGSCTSSSSNVVQSIGADGSVGCGNLQNRVTGSCTGTSAAQAVNANGTLSCTSSLQNRVTGSCSNRQAVQSVAADGTTTCSSDFTPANRVFDSFPSDVPAGVNVSLATTPGGIDVRARCTSASPPKAEIYVVAPGGANIVWNTPQQGFQGLGPVGSQTVASSSSLDGGTLIVGGTSGQVAGSMFSGQFYLFAGAASCQFVLSGTSN